MLEVDFAGETFEYDPDSLLMSELQDIKKVTGMTRKEWLTALVDEEVEAVIALIYLLRKRRGDSVRFGDIDGTWNSFTVRRVDSDEDSSEGPTEATAESEPDPT